VDSCKLKIVDDARETRSERKERTRRALLDHALALSVDRGFAALSLREVARSCGIVPTAFYRHFATLDELGLTLVEEAIRDIRALLRELRRSPDQLRLRPCVTAVFEHVAAHRELLSFLARERHGGSAALRAAIADGLDLIARELAVDLSRVAPDTVADEVLARAARMLVSTAAEHIAVFVADDAASLTETEAQLRLILLGMTAWNGSGAVP
jgi:AcrR family transcriptional regulator